ncbi:competence type IV pilus minor pilin ComGE [Streptococcus halichoeri]|uniref:competence type IV pilus minor pilin ComGE n=1 Tax=Streptococcus halichoeri TaxID=254785 RepID=UPI00135CD34C
MVIIKRQNINAYILLECLISVGLFAYIALVLLTCLQTQQRQVNIWRQEEEALAGAVMAIQTKQDQLGLNGHDLTIEKTEHFVRIKEQRKTIVTIEKIKQKSDSTNESKAGAKSRPKNKG